MPKSEKYKKRADGRYCAAVNTGKKNDKTGQPIRITIYAESSKELEKLVAAKRYELDHGMASKDTPVRFGDYAKKWLSVACDTKGIRTKEMYANIIKNHIEYLEMIKLKDITRSDVQMQINKKSEHTRICEILRMTIKQILDSAIDDGLLYKNVCSKISLPKRIVSEKRALTEIEKKRIKKCDFTIKEKAYVSLLYGCGLRPGEAKALTKGDIDIKNGTININKACTFDGNKAVIKETKTASGERTIQAPNSTIKALEEYIDILDGLMLFTDMDGQPMTRSGYKNFWNQIVKKICPNGNLEKLTSYTFRHNYCTELYYSNISMKEAQRLMGHSDYKMIMNVYSHLDEKKEKTSVKINKRLSL